MNVFIITEGGRDIGFGHLTRCVSIYEAFLERKFRPVFVINDSPDARNFLKMNGIEGFLSKEPSVTSDDILIVDSYLKSGDFYARFLKKAKLVVAIDDFKRLEYPADIVVNGSVYGREIDYNKNRGSRYLLGVEYIPLRKSFWRGRPKKIRKEVKDVLITFGGFKEVFTQRVIKFLLENFSFNLHAIANKSKGQIKSGRISYYSNLLEDKMEELMLGLDVCLSGGGQTAYELAACGLPAVALCFAKNQVLNLRGGAKYGYLKFAGWYNDKDIFGKIEKSLELLDYQSRLKMSRKGRETVDGRGAQRIVREILDYA